MSIAEWEKEASAFTEKVEVCFDRKLVAELEGAQADLKAAKRGMLEAPEELENHVAELAKQVEAKTRTFVFQSIGRRKWRKLLADHPPTDEQKETIKLTDVLGRPVEIDHNPETFPQAAMVACCTEPGLTLEEANWLAEELPEAVYLRFSNAVFQVNILGGDEKKAVATAVARPTDER